MLHQIRRIREISQIRELKSFGRSKPDSWSPRKSLRKQKINQELIEVAAAMLMLSVGG